MKHTIIKIISWLVLAVLLVGFPKIFGVYYTNVFITFAIFAVYSVSLNVLLGYTGLLSFGHAIFFGIGGYGTALALTHIEGIGLFPALGIGLLAASGLALILYPLVTRITGTAFCMLHLALGQLFYVLALKLRNITGGEDGISNFPVPDFNIPGIVSVTMKGEPVNFYYLAIVILGICLFLMWAFTKTPFGQIQVGIRDNAKRIDYLGYKVPQSKAVVYVISGAFAGIAGAVYGLFHNMVSADGSLGAMVSFAPIISTMIGGMGSFFGPIWGTAIFQLLEELITRFTDRIELVTGITLILVMMFAPRGLAGFFTMVKQRWQARTTMDAKVEKTL